MDLSLDDYMSKKDMNSRKPGQNIRQRLGIKSTPGQSALQRARNQRGFDARQKLTAKKIQSQTNVTDARQRLQKKKTGAATPSSAKNLPANDMRNKLNKKIDARTKIQARRNAKNPKSFAASPTQVTLMGNKRVLHAGSGTNLTATQPGTLTRTISGLAQPTGVNVQFGALKKTIVNRPNPQAASFFQQSQVPKVEIRNDMYQPPRQPQPTVQTPWYTPEEDTVRTRPLAMDQVRPTQQYSAVSSRLDQPLTMEPQVSAPVYSSTVRTQAYMDQPVVRRPAVRTTPVYEQAPAQAVGRVSQPAGTMSQPVASVSQGDVSGAPQGISPLQGCRVLVTNLHQVVTQDDIVELFGAVGALKKARLLKLGSAEVVFVNREDAQAAVRKYHMRELDGQPMKVSLTTPSTAATKTTNLPLRHGGSSETNSGGLDSTVDINLLHKALFRTNTRDDSSSGPVSFTVKI